MFKRTALFTALVFFILFSIGSYPAYGKEQVKEFSRSISIRADRFYLQDSPFLIKAVGWAGWRPGQTPGVDKVDITIVEEDFKRIKEAGFNTIRTWDALSEDELVIANKYGLWVIQGIWIDPTRDLNDPVFQAQMKEYVGTVVDRTKKFKNILMYMVMTEPKQNAILYTGGKGTISFFKDLKRIISLRDNVPVSMDSWIPIGFVDHSMWDIVTVNAYMFVPESIIKAIGFQSYLGWMKNNIAKNKPFFIGETGGFSVSSGRLNDIGFGGHTEQGQSQGNIESIKQSLASGAIGTVLVSWVDTWHYPADPKTQGNNPWEWDGLVDVSGGNLIGRPREVLSKVTEFNKSAGEEYNNKTAPAQEVTLDLQAYLNRHELTIKGSVYKGSLIFKHQKIRFGVFFPGNEKDFFVETVTDSAGKFIVKMPEPASAEFQLVVVSIGFDKEEKSYAQIKFLPLGKFYRKDLRRFFVFKDKDDPRNHFYYSGWVGDTQSLQMGLVDNDCHSVSCIQVRYVPKQGDKGHWAGVYWQNPPQNWNKKAGGYNLARYKKLVFWAKGEKGGEILSTVGVGGESPNTASVRKAGLRLTKDWQKFEIPFKGNNFSNIIHGFSFFLTGLDNNQGAVFYLDDIYFE